MREKPAQRQNQSFRGQERKPWRKPGHWARSSHAQEDSTEEVAELWPWAWWDNQEESGLMAAGLDGPGMTEPGSSYHGSLFHQDMKKPILLFPFPQGHSTISVHIPRASRLSKLFLTLNRRVEDYRTYQRKAPREGGTRAGHRTGEVSLGLKARAEPHSEQCICSGKEGGGVRH